MRLLFVSPHYGTVGGIRLVIDALATAARASGHEVAAVVDGDGAAFGGPAHEVRCYPFPPRARDVRRLQRFARKFPADALRLVRAVRACTPDVVNVHCFRRFAPYAALLRRLTRVPQVVSLHEGTLMPGMPENRGLFRLLVSSGELVVACSEDVASYARQVGHASRVAVVLNGYDPDEFRSASTFAHPRPYLLGVGRLEPQKGFDVLVDALARLARRDVDLLLAGEGSRRGEIEARARARGVETQVRFLGVTDRPTTVALLRGAAVVACPSRFEGFPLVCLEALAAGRPVVASAVNGVPEIIRDGETGVLVPPEDPALLAAALDRLLANPARAEQLGARGRELVERHHPWAAVTGRYLALLAEVGGGRDQRAAA